MTDNNQSTGNPDRNLISLEEEYEVNDWAQKYNVTSAELRKAVQAVGNKAEDVGRFLKARKN